MITGLAMLDLQGVILETLRADSTLAALVSTRIFEGRVPPGTKMPYVIVDSWFETPEDILARTGRSTTFMVHIYSNQSGFQESKLIGSAVVLMFDKVPVEVENWPCWRLALRSANALVEAPEQNRHVVLLFEARTQEAL